MKLPEEIKDANVAAQIVDEAGLSFQRGTVPTSDQAAIAAVHGREDAALSVALLSKSLQRLDRVLLWLKVIAAMVAVDLLHRCS